MNIDFENYYEDKDNWEFDLVPRIFIYRDMDYSKSIGIGISWLFYELILFIKIKK